MKWQACERSFLRAIVSEAEDSSCPFAILVPYLSSMAIHPTAVVDSQAQLGADVSIGPYAIVEGGVSIGDGCEVSGHAQLLGTVDIGEGCKVGPGAVLGAFPQDLSFDRTRFSGVKIGAGCDLREHVTIHRSTKPGVVTTLGERNFFMVGAHVGHDSQVGDDNVIANHCLIGGHVHIGNGNFLGAGAGFHQFVRVGDRVMVQGLTACSLDFPPYVMAAERNRIFGLNSVGLRRAGFSKEARAEVKEVFKLFFRSQLRLQEALGKARERIWGPEAEQFLKFVGGKSKKGICLRTA
ncbi:MAG: acyl-ACP--UDP-N-acetylglucosamine O-acyltransferase [Verrucomicrobiaceae bacterium]|nr:acyl-ACP--UDP-N-acetylglucosamine O-acyltransferase [Verrucomicrobiaceae bacterium]